MINDRTIPNHLTHGDSVGEAEDGVTQQLRARVRALADSYESLLLSHTMISKENVYMRRAMRDIERLNPKGDVANIVKVALEYYGQEKPQS